MTDLRALAAAQLPEGAFLRRDRGGALYVTNAPAKGWSGDIKGFSAKISGGIAKLTPDGGTMQTCDFVPDALAKELSRFTGVSDEAITVFAACIKCAEAPDAVSYEKCDRMLRQSAAKALRAGGGEGLYYCALALAEAGRRMNAQK